MKSEILNSVTLLMDKVDARTPRERLLILVLGVALIWALFDIALFNPQEKEIKTAVEMESGIRGRIKGWEAEISSIQTTHKGASTAEIQQKKIELEKQLSDLNNKLIEIASHVVPPRSMASLLEEALLENEGLRLINIQTLPVKPMSGDLFMHPLMLVFEGNYFEALRYLQKIEQLHWRFFWDELEYVVTAYPMAKVTVKLHTLSEKFSWLDV